VRIQSIVGPVATLDIEVHVADVAPQFRTITTTPPLKHKPEVGEDVAIKMRPGEQTVGHEYRIAWGEPPHYGIPTPTQQQIQDAVVPGLLTDDPAAKPPGLADAERMRDAGEVSEAAFQTMKANILRPHEELERLHNSGQMSDEIYATAIANERRFAAGVKIGHIPTPEEAAANLKHGMDDSAELDLQQRGTLTFATVVALPTPVAGDRFSMTMPLDVKSPEGGAEYRVDCTFPAARPIEDLAVGTVLPVKVDPERRQHVAVIWTRWLADRNKEATPPASPA
ncbi:MAG TPA: hypothetical protein VN671_04035, partial [Solirubrobacterales bacterium]|nr:hypothetical protein [Solirubrobacterales bacterium]